MVNIRENTLLNRIDCNIFGGLVFASALHRTNVERAELVIPVIPTDSGVNLSGALSTRVQHKHIPNPAGAVGRMKEPDKKKEAAAMYRERLRPGRVLISVAIRAFSRRSALAFPRTARISHYLRKVRNRVKPRKQGRVSSPYLYDGRMRKRACEFQ